MVIVGASPWTTELALELKELGITTLIIDSAWYKLKEPRQLGLNTHFGEAVMELEEANIDLTEYSFLLAATDSNSYNALVCNAYTEDLGQNNVYQIPLGEEQDNLIEELPNAHSGRVVDTEINKAYKGNIKELFNQGWAFKKSNLTEEYQLNDFYEDNPPTSTINLLRIEKDKSIHFITNASKVKAKAGDTIISFSKLAN